MNYTFDGAYRLPGTSELLETFENNFLWGKEESLIWTNVVIGGASRDVGNTGNTTILRPGLLLGRVTATNKIKEWNPSGTDGSQYIFGILGLNPNMQTLGTNRDRWLGQILVSGTVKAANLIIPGNASMGISGDANEFAVRTALHPRFLLDDDIDLRLVGGSGGAGVAAEVVAKTADYTVLQADNGTLFTNRGAAGAVIFTLPATPTKGLTFHFQAVAAQDFTITSGTADTLITLGDATADSVALVTSGKIIGGGFTVIGDGTGWLVRPYNWISALAASIPAAVAGTLTGTVTGTIVDVAAAACAGGSTPTAAQVDTAIDDLEASTNLALKELQTQLNLVIAAIQTVTKAT